MGNVSLNPYILEYVISKEKSPNKFALKTTIDCQNLEPKSEQRCEWKLKQKRRPKRFIFFFIFIIMAYLLNIGSRGWQKTLCRPKNSNEE